MIAASRVHALSPALLLMSSVAVADDPIWPVCSSAEHSIFILPNETPALLLAEKDVSTLMPSMDNQVALNGCCQVSMRSPEIVACQIPLVLRSSWPSTVNDSLSLDSPPGLETARVAFMPRLRSSQIDSAENTTSFTKTGTLALNISVAGIVKNVSIVVANVAPVWRRSVGKKEE